MIYIVTALYAEAHAFIARFQLKKDISHTRFQVFQNKEAGICLIISGTGSIPAAVAVSSIFTECGARQGDFLLNTGVCAGIRIQPPHGIFLCNKITEQITGKTFYPDILYRHAFPEAQVITGIKPYEKAKQTERKETAPYLYDMEAAAIYQAGAYYLGPHQMSFLKIVSDNGDAAGVTPSLIEHLIGDNMEDIADYITTLQSIACHERQSSLVREEEALKISEKLCYDMHCSKAMSESVRQYIRYSMLSNSDYASVLEKMYQEGKLPCKDKREGKQCFEELKKRLL